MVSNLHIVVDESWQESTAEYAAALDHLVEGSTFSEKLQKHISEDKPTPALFQELLETIDTLKSLRDSDFEPLFNLLIHTLTFSQDFESLISQSQIISQLASIETKDARDFFNRDKKSIKSTTIISILSTIFNLVPSSSKFRVSILDAILSIIEKNQAFQLAVPITESLKLWLTQAGASKEVIGDFLFRVFSMYYNIDQTAAIEFYNQQALQNASAEHRDAFIIKCLSTEKVLDLRALSKKFNDNAPVCELLKIYVSHDLQKLEQFGKSNLEKLDISFDALAYKLRILTVARLALQSSTLPYSQVSDELHINQDEVETCLIDAVNEGIISGRISQLEQVFYVYKVSVFGEFSKENWKTISSSLNTWSSTLKEVQSIISTADANKKRVFQEYQEREVAAFKKAQAEAEAAAAAAAAEQEEFLQNELEVSDDESEEIEDEPVVELGEQ